MKDLKEKTCIIRTWEAFSFSSKMVPNACGKNLSNLSKTTELSVKQQIQDKVWSDAQA